MIITRHAQQAPADVAVVMPSILRPSLLRAARSVFAQAFSGRIHLLIGVDIASGDRAILDILSAECPSHVMLTVFDPGYSTSRRHGGRYANAYGGALRSILTLAANSDAIAYLDDNDWYAPMHLDLLRGALAGRDWAFSHRWLVDPHTGWPICPDEWDSLGPGKGINAAVFGGFVQPSTLMLHAPATGFVVPLWAEAPFPDGSGEDRLIFQALRERPHGQVAHPTCFCTLNAGSVQDDHHLREFQARGLHWITNRALVPQLQAHLQEAAAQRAAGDIMAAARSCRAALAIHPHHAGALRLLGGCLHAAGLEDQAALLHTQADLLDFAKDTPC